MEFTDRPNTDVLPPRSDRAHEDGLAYDEGLVNNLREAHHSILFEFDDNEDDENGATVRIHLCEYRFISTKLLLYCGGPDCIRNSEYTPGIPLEQSVPA